MEKILSKLEETVGRINTHPEYSGLLKIRYSNWLREEAQKHSLTVGITKPKDKVKETKEYKERLKNLCAARDFLYSEGISMYSISTLGRFIEPAANYRGQFRLLPVTFEDFGSLSPLTVPEQIEDLIYRLNRSDEKNPVLKAADAHLSIIQIQPFMNGNKRAARLLQNFCLEKEGFPPIIIPEEEGDLYRRLLNNALTDRYSKKSNSFNCSNSEEAFNEYLLTKELISARRLEEELSKKRNYTLYLTRVKDKGILMTVKNSLKSEAKKVNNEGSVFSDRGIGGKAYEIAYQGPLESSRIKAYLEKLSEKYNFNFEIKYNRQNE